MWRSKTSGIVVVLLATLLVFVVIFGVVNQAREKNISELGAVLSEVQHKYDEGTALIDLNPVRARALLGEAKFLLESKAELAVSGSDQKDVDAFLQKITESLSFAVRRYEVPLNSYFELSLVKPGGQGFQMSLYQDALVILDPKNKTIYRLSISSKSARVLSGNSELGTARSISVHGEDVYVLTDGVKKVSLPSGDLAAVVSSDTEWGDVNEFAAYAGNLYLLDAGKNQIWKYIRTETGFSGKQDYLLFDTLVDLSSSQNIAIDGYVWLTREGDIIRFAQGQEYHWKFAGLEDALGKNLNIYTDDTTKNIYVLDTENKRVVVADKDGVYLAQYAWTSDANISDMVVSEVVKKILLLSGGTIYGIDLK